MAEILSKRAFIETYASNHGRKVLAEKVTLLHCTSRYPTPLSEANLLAIQIMREQFELSIGYSDHTEGIIAPIIALAMGATVLEKHLTLDKTLPGPDHGASLEPNEFKEMVKAIRKGEIALGVSEEKCKL